MRLVIAFCALALVSGCGGISDHDSLRYSEVGRYEFYPASDEMPAVLLDTMTGCIEHFVKLTSKTNPQDVTWARRYIEVGLPTDSFLGNYQLPVSDQNDDKAGRYPIGTQGSIENLAPPLRCKPAVKDKK
jgi:hypothetical protein